MTADRERVLEKRVKALDALLAENGCFQLSEGWVWELVHEEDEATFSEVLAKLAKVVRAFRRLHITVTPGAGMLAETSGDDDEDDEEMQPEGPGFPEKPAKPAKPAKQIDPAYL